MSPREKHNAGKDCDIGDLEDFVCRARNSAAVLRLGMEEVVFQAAHHKIIPTRDEREMLAFAMYEALDCAEAAKAEFLRLTTTDPGARP